MVALLFYSVQEHYLKTRTTSIHRFSIKKRVVILFPPHGFERHGDVTRYWKYGICKFRSSTLSFVIIGNWHQPCWMFTTRTRHSGWNGGRTNEGAARRRSLVDTRGFTVYGVLKLSLEETAFGFWEKSWKWQYNENSNNELCRTFHYFFYT
jgi:hypothetical protein